MTTPTSGPEIWPDGQRAIWQACRHPTGAFVDFPPSEIEQSIPERFAAQVRRHAQRPAVIGARATLSCEALDRRANAVADGLLALGRPAGEHVALLLERDVHLVVALLGVLKADLRTSFPHRNGPLRSTLPRCKWPQGRGRPTP